MSKAGDEAAGGSRGARGKAARSTNTTGQDVSTTVPPEASQEAEESGFEVVLRSLPPDYLREQLWQPLDRDSRLALRLACR